MNPAAPSSSDSSIAQAFREFDAMPNDDGSREVRQSLQRAADWIKKRARELDASEPAAAVGVATGECVGSVFFHNTEGGHAAFSFTPNDAAWQHVDSLKWEGGEYGGKTFSVFTTPAAPVGGFVVVCKTCNGGGCVDGFVAHPSGDPQDSYAAEVPCPDCDGAGEVPAESNADNVVFQGTTADLQSAYFGDWSAALAWAGKNGSVTMHTVRRLEVAASPTAQPSAKDGVRGDEE